VVPRAGRVAGSEEDIRPTLPRTNGDPISGSWSSWSFPSVALRCVQRGPPQCAVVRSWAAVSLDGCQADGGFS